MVCKLMAMARPSDVKHEDDRCQSDNFSVKGLHLQFVSSENLGQGECGAAVGIVEKSWC